MLILDFVAEQFLKEWFNSWAYCEQFGWSILVFFCSFYHYCQASADVPLMACFQQPEKKLFFDFSFVKNE
jgi:hypothetical protein